MNPQTIARVFGVLYLITFVTSIPAFFFYAPVLNDPRYVVGAGADTSVAFGAFLELILIVANIATAVVPYPILRRHNEILALGYVTARILECTFIAVGILSLLTIVTLRQEAAAGADAASLVTAGKTLVALQEWTRCSDPASSSASGTGFFWAT
jgi:branched-subunit amino acid transport protein AzlD